ncbi:uncharacterized protein B0H18DRAFT_1118359 [Fomitopsis serialis]|uniref:uncharacterized protein n=1 Tax=Fomitopsis serialis TaxID=139415 RepID=UPI0020080C88|nr:uncharacterized protein B0H18DRAFT_1118359 [Neoantrodia serialis]KAH9927846.1 hypothetical protein B0H18DRAFT_1118359 [Neoantrodia serialis]
MDAGTGYTRGNVPEVSPGAGTVCDPRHTATTAYPPSGVAVWRGGDPRRCCQKRQLRERPNVALARLPRLLPTSSLNLSNDAAWTRARAGTTTSVQRANAPDGWTAGTPAVGRRGEHPKARDPVRTASTGKRRARAQRRGRITGADGKGADGERIAGLSTRCVQTHASEPTNADAGHGSVQRDAHDDREHAGPAPCVQARPTNARRADNRTGGQAATHANRERVGRMPNTQTRPTNQQPTNQQPTDGHARGGCLARKLDRGPYRVRGNKTGEGEWSTAGEGKRGRVGGDVQHGAGERAEGGWESGRASGRAGSRLDGREKGQTGGQAGRRGDGRVVEKTDSKLKALREEVRAKLAASQERINKALEESKQLEADLLATVDAALSEASSRSRSSRTKTTRTESSHREDSAGALTEQAPSDREVEQAPRAEQLEPNVELAQSRPETDSPPATSQPMKFGTTRRSGERAELDDVAVVELVPGVNEQRQELTRISTREGIGTQYYSSTVCSGNEPTRVDTPVACSEMSRDTKSIYSLSNDVRALSSSLLDATRDALDPTGVERHGSVASGLSASAHRTALDRHHRLHVLDHSHSLGSHLERPSGEPDARGAPTRVRTRVREWLSDLPPVQSVATDDLVLHGTRSPPPSSPDPRLSPLVSRLDPYRGSGDTQRSRVIQDLNDARSSPAPSSRTERTTKDAERGEQKEDRETGSDSEEKEGTKGQREEGCGASRKHEPEGSTTTGTYSLYVPASQPPLPVPALAGVATNEKLVVHPASHEEGNHVPRYDCEVVPDVPCGSTSVLRDDLQVVPSIPSVPAPVGVPTNSRLVVRTTGHDYGTTALRYDCEVVPDVPRVLRYDPEVVPGPFTLQGDTTDAQYCTSDVPHQSMTGYRVADTPQADVSTSIPILLAVPAPASAAKNVKVTERAAGHEDGRSALQDDLLVVSSDPQGRTLALGDDREVVPSSSQGCAMETQHFAFDVLCSGNNDRFIAHTPNLLLDVHAIDRHEGSKSEDTSRRNVLTLTHARSAPARASTPVSVTTNREPAESIARDSSGHRLFIAAPMITSDHEDGTFELRDDPMVVPSALQSGAPVLVDDREVVPSISQGGTTDQQRCRSEVFHLTSTGCDAVFTDSLSDSSIALTSASQDGSHFREEVQVSGCSDAAESSVVQLAKPWDDPGDPFGDALDSTRSLEGRPPRMASLREARTVPWRAQVVRTCTDEPPAVQLAGPPDGLVITSDGHQFRADASQENLHILQGVQVSVSGLKTAEPCAVELASPDLDLDFSSNHSLRDPGAPTSAQPDDRVLLKNARARARDPTAALPVVQRPALTKPDTPDRCPDRQPGENFTVLAEGSLLGNPTQRSIDFSMVSDTHGDYDGHHESEIAREPWGTRVGPNDGQGGTRAI